jgi:DNA-binding LacI/PurR family transcriptional regulator
VRKATLRDIAAAAGVSVATASRVLNRPDMVSVTLRERIQALCREHRYVPNHAARSLTLDRSKALGLVVPTLSNPVFSPLIEQMQATLEARDYGLLIHCSHRDPARELRQCRTLIERGVDGIILGNPEHDPALFETLRMFGMPFLCVAGSAAATAGRPAITYDAGAAMRLALDHLVAFGHRAIAVLSGPAGTTPVIADRLASLRAAMREPGLMPPPAWWVECDYDAAGARKGAAALLDGPNLPTAILCTGDLHAMAAVAECHARGLAVPRDMSVVGCNDMAIAQFSTPALSTVHTPYEAMGAQAAELMLAMIAGEKVARFTLLPSHLVERGSVAPPRSG